MAVSMPTASGVRLVDTVAVSEAVEAIEQAITATTIHQATPQAVQKVLTAEPWTPIIQWTP